MVRHRTTNFNEVPPHKDRYEAESRDATLAGRIYHLLSAAEKQPIVSSDDALLYDELRNRRLGNPKLVGQAVAYCHRKGWLKPLHDLNGCRLSKKSERHYRACGIIELWTRTETTHEGIEWAERLRKPLPKSPCLLDFIALEGRAAR